MALKLTSRDIQEIVSKLSSDKDKAREVIKKIDFYWRVCSVSWREGVKLLNTWLETDRSIGFTRYLSDKTSVLKPKEVPHSETWPFLVKILMQCASSEISSSKKRLPKSIFAKTLRIIVKRAQDDGCSGKKNLLLHVAKSLFNHVWDVLKDVPSFQSEDEGKISRKLVECINTYLLKDGPNLGGKSLEIHQAVNHFVFRYWFATHDRSLKDSLICYAKLQVSLTRGVDDGSILLELVDVMSKELDQMSTSSTNSPEGEKCGIMTSSQFKVAELVALVFCRVCANTYKSPVTEKCARREHVVVLIKESRGGQMAMACCTCLSHPQLFYSHP
ncbi:serine/threonine-protein kinase ATM-like isoform X9 [Primulina tabacum]|uniref:serine/threonine-protein kinase ATM-like isoform X9 n=1 Tax=Primulina tabacum TaxID=48773 RepID=UPI003F5A0D87